MMISNLENKFYYNFPCELGFRCYNVDNPKAFEFECVSYFVKSEISKRHLMNLF